MNFPSLPKDKNRIGLIISCIAVYFLTIGAINLYNNHLSIIRQHIDAGVELESARLHLALAKDELLLAARKQENIHGISLIKHKDSSTTLLTGYLSTDEKFTAAFIALKPIWELYQAKKVEVQSFKYIKRRYELEFDATNELTWVLIRLLFFGLVFCVIAFLGSIIGIIDRRSYKVRQKGAIWCQSCGRKFSSKIIAGTNRDGTKNYAFCEDCFENGVFKESDDVAYHSAISNIESLGVALSKSRRKNLIGRIKKLDRWRIDNY